MARRDGADVETVKKFGGGGNKQTAGPSNARKLEDSEELKHDTVPRELRLAIQRARMDKKWSQAELARAINERQQVVNDYESGKAIPNNQVISKMERVLGARLPRRPSKKQNPLCTRHHNNLAC
eukprot:TRINITY_DN26697_c0_g1_i1.p2 TRINITY_DN26697_c0_g1~~TRINITY_DN26697_c0_g1_i1.p2  ORF type:complete len:124 (-),score=27.55 TRINITY_DN26697_c0_g1_i1:20-391(-)